jgi:ribosomal-protein-alanine N-acetyltransferase
VAAVPEELALDVAVLPMRRRHLRAVLRIEALVYPRPWSLGLFMSELALRTTRVYLVAKVGNDVVGYAGLMVTGSDGHVTTVAVDPDWHRNGIGTRLVLGLCRAAAERGCTGMTLEVRVGNTGAQELYRAFGFAPAGVRKNYYTETNEDTTSISPRTGSDSTSSPHRCGARRRGRVSPDDRARVRRRPHDDDPRHRDVV